MKNNYSNSLFFMKSDILNIHLTNTIHRINDSIKNQSYTADKFCMLSKFGPESWALSAVLSALFTPRLMIAAMLNYRSLRGENYTFSHFMLNRGYVASDLGLHCSPTSHKKEARLK